MRPRNHCRATAAHATALAEATLSSKNQIVIPKEAREALKVKPGDKLIVTVLENKIIVMEKPKSWSKAIRNLPRTNYPPDYLEKERADWD
jgi:AbrB family looped-hinge helix DNA binding protein